MKLFPVFLIASLAVNILLVVALTRNALGPTPASERIAAPAVVDNKPAQSSLAVEAWAELHTDDLAAQVERLRAEDFPPSLIRAIIAARVRERFAARRKALAEAEAATPFWIANRDPKLQAEQRALFREEQKALRDSLGPDPQSGVAASVRRMLPDFPPDKIDQLAQIQERYNDQRADLYAASAGRILPDESHKLEALEKAMRAELVAVLTPQELEDYDLRASRTAMQVRNNLAAFDATEQEYRAIFKLQQAFDEQFSVFRADASQEQMRARGDATRQLNEQIKSTLGSDRYADYQRATDSNYRRTTQLVERLGLPPSTANEIYATQRSVQDRAMELRRAAVSDRATQLAALAAEAEATISAKLGTAGFEAYKQHGGSWLTNLAPRPATPPKKAD